MKPIETIARRSEAMTILASREIRRLTRGLPANHRNELKLSGVQNSPKPLLRNRIWTYLPPEWTLLVNR